MQLLIATHNEGKLREFAEIFQDLPFELVTLDQIGITEDVEETGTTFEQNALLKAQTYAKQSGLLALGDDSGLVVDALGGEPGVYSKRYAGENKSDAQRNVYLLEKLKDVPLPQRTARFRSVIMIVSPQGEIWTADGTCEGAIAFDARGTNGFGYDPIFVVTETGTRMAELPPEVKNKLSHRGRAARVARKILEQIAANS